MAQASVHAAEGLKNDLMSAYHESASAAYRTMGISTMNGVTDTGELVSAADFQCLCSATCWPTTWRGSRSGR